MKRGQINLMEQRFFRNLSESGLWQTPESSVRQFSNYHLSRSLMPARKRERKEQNANSYRMPYYRMPSMEVSTEGETLSHGFKNLHRLVRGKFDTRNGKAATVREPGTRAGDWESLRNGTTYTLYRMIQARLWESQNEYTHCFMHMYDYVLEKGWKMLPNIFQETDFLEEGKITNAPFTVESTDVPCEKELRGHVLRQVRSQTSLTSELKGSPRQKGELQTQCIRSFAVRGSCLPTSACHNTTGRQVTN